MNCNTHYMGRQHVWLEKTDSTNEVIKRLLKEDATIESLGGDLHGLLEGIPEDGFLVVADHQTTGKGRSGRIWNDEKGSSIAMSVMLKPRVGAESVSMVTLVSAIAVARSIKEVCDLDAMIKWPNDIIIDGRKVCGILTEYITDGKAPCLIIGIGINVNQAVMPEDIADRAISLYMASGDGTVYDREDLIEDIMQNLEYYYGVFTENKDMSGLLDIYSDMLINTDRRVRVEDPQQAFEGMAKGIDIQGRLLVETDDGVMHAVSAGEVSVRGIYGYV